MEHKRDSVLGFRKADKNVLKWSEYCGYAGAAAVLVIMVIGVVDVILSKTIKSSVPSGNEWITYLNVLIVYAPLAYVQLSRGHVQVDLIREKIPPSGQKAVRIFSLVFSLIVFLLLFYCGIKLMSNQISSGQRSSSDALAKGAFDLWIFGAIYTVGCAMAAFSFLWCIIREFFGGIAAKAENAQQSRKEGEKE